MWATSKGPDGLGGEASENENGKRHVDGKETAVAGSDLQSFGKEDKDAGHHEAGYPAAGELEKKRSQDLHGAEGNDGESGEFVKPDGAFSPGKKLPGESRTGGHHRSV